MEMRVVARSVNWDVCGPAPGPTRKVRELGRLRPGAPDHLAAARRLPLGLTGNRAFHWKDRAPKDHPAGAPRDSARRGRRGRRRHGRGCNLRRIGRFAARPRDRPAKVGELGRFRPGAPDHLAAARRLPLGLTGNRAFHWKDRKSVV